MGDRLDLSEPLPDAELVGYIMRARIFDAHDVVMALHAPELRRACEVLGVWHRGGRKAELREHLNGAVGHSYDRPMPPDQPGPRFDEATGDWIWPDWDARQLRWVWPEPHRGGTLNAAAHSGPRG